MISNSLNYTKEGIKDVLRYKTEARLRDPFSNGVEYFSLNLSVWQDGQESWVRSYRDCLLLCPEVLPIYKLHLCDWQGVPMHSTANGYYHYLNNTGHGQSYVRASEDEWSHLKSAKPDSEVAYGKLLTLMGFRDRWKQEAQAAIEILEGLSKCKFESRFKRSYWKNDE